MCTYVFYELLALIRLISNVEVTFVDKYNAEIKNVSTSNIKYTMENNFGLLDSNRST